MAKAEHPPAREYNLLITPTFDEREMVYKTLVELKTKQQFSTFRYELSVDEQLTGKTLRLKVRGLTPPQRSLPGAGPARFSRKYDGLNGTCEVSVEGLDGKVNAFSVRISPKKVVLVKSPRSRFVDLVTDQTLWPND